LLDNKPGFAWEQVLFGLESWYLNLLVPILAAFVLLIVFYFVGRQEHKVFMLHNHGEIIWM